MTRSVLGRLFVLGPNHKVRSCGLNASLEGLESRLALSSGSVVETGALVTVTPASTGPNIAIVSYQVQGGTTVLDVNLNGTDNYFSLKQVGFVYYEGSGFGGSQTFENNTSLHTVAWGGSGTNLFESNGGAQDEFFGGSGGNTFDAGTGFDLLVGGSGGNVFNESVTGSGEIIEDGNSNTINVPPGATGHYTIV